MFAGSLSGSVLLSVSQNVFQSRLLRELESRAPNVDPVLVIASGASGLRPAMTGLYDAQIAERVLESFVEALKPVWIIGTVLAAASLLGSLATEWVSIKEKDGQGEREEDTAESTQ